MKKWIHPIVFLGLILGFSEEAAVEYGTNQIKTVQPDIEHEATATTEENPKKFLTEPNKQHEEVSKEKAQDQLKREFTSQTNQARIPITHSISRKKIRS